MTDLIKSFPDAQPICEIGSPRNREHNWFIAVLVGLTLLALTAIWSARFLPMQDHPQHLFLALASVNLHEETVNWGDYYKEQRNFGPYMLYYAVMNPLLKLFTPETASRIWVSVILLMLVLFTWSEAKRRQVEDSVVPWALILFVPLSFHQMYFLGFQNYLISIPACLFALRAWMDICTQYGNRQRSAWLALAFWLMIVLFAHPYSLLVFITLSSFVALFESNEDTPKTLLALPGGAFLFLIIWLYLNGFSDRTNANQTPWEIQWLHLKQIVEFCIMYFTGMQITDKISPIHLTSWSAILIAVLWAGSTRPKPEFPKILVAMFIACASGVLLMPFWLAQYSYFNLRLLPFVYFFGVLLLSRLSFGWLQCTILCIAATLLVGTEVKRHMSISEEISSILPIINVMEPNSKILPLYGYSASQFLDSTYFYQFHQHEHYYYHVLRGGGANPFLFPSTMIPLALQNDADLPSPSNSIAQSAAYYDYVISRGIPTEFLEDELDTMVTSENEDWALFKLRLQD